MADEKQLLRKVLDDARRYLSAVYERSLSEVVQRRLLALDCFGRAPAVVLYAAKGGEVSTELIWRAALAQGKTAYFPRFNSLLNTLSLVAVAELAALKPGAFGVLEPPGPGRMDLTALNQALVCVPGVAFAAGGLRLGRGGGHYDRLLSELDGRVMKVGLAYSFQFIDHLPEGPGDQRLDLVVTDFSVHRGKPLESWCG